MTERVNSGGLMAEKKPFEDFRCSRGSTGRYAEQPTKPEGITERTIYQHDKGAITYSKIFKRLGHKFHLVAKRDDHSRSKLLHTLEVSTIATEMADILGLDTALTEAICLGHDLGSYPFGRIGEDAIKKKLGSFWAKKLSHPHLSCNLLSLEYMVMQSRDPERFNRLRTETQCFEVKKTPTGAEYIVSISEETLDGILHHQSEENRYANIPQTVEAQLVRAADNFAYITQELEDALGLGMDFEKHKNNGRLRCEAARSTLAPSLQKEGFTQKNELTWAELKEEAAHHKINPVDIFDKESTGKRLNAMIHWFINHNVEKLREDNLGKHKSNIMGCELPILEYPEGLNFCLDYVWSEIIVREIHNKYTVKQNFELARQMVGIVFDNVMDSWEKEITGTIWGSVR